MSRRSHLLTIAAVLTTVASTGCGSTGPDSSTGHSGVTGLVTVDGACLNARQVASCPPTPTAATIQVLDDAGQKVAIVKAGSDGRFRVALPPGNYRLSPAPLMSDSTLTAPDVSVTVPADGFADATIRYPSGVL